MTPRLARLLALVVPAVLACAAVGVTPTYAGRATARKAVDQQQKIVVKWDAQKR